jgi:hypothetical protein
MNEKAVEMELTPEQKEQLRRLTGKAVSRVKLNLEQLETRVAPKLAVN